MFTFISLHHPDAQRFKHGRHGWVDVLIRTSDKMTTRLQHSSKRSHSGTANTDQVIVHIGHEKEILLLTSREIFFLLRQFKIVIDHQANQLFEPDFRLPTQFPAGLCRITK